MNVNKSFQESLKEYKTFMKKVDSAMSLIQFTTRKKKVK